MVGQGSSSDSQELEDGVSMAEDITHRLWWFKLDLTWKICSLPSMVSKCTIQNFKRGKELNSST